MGSVHRFEDLIAWQKARVLTKAIYEITSKGGFASDFGLAHQIQRAAVSIMSNIAEGFERERPADFKRFLGIAKASCGEVRSQLYVALDVGYLEEKSFQKLMDQASEAAPVIRSLRSSIRDNRS